MPLAVTLLISACGLRNEDPCIFQDTIPDYLYWECPDGDFLNDFISNQHAWIWIVWLLSQTWIGIHIFMPHCERLAPTEKLFVTPMYLSLLIGNFLRTEATKIYNRFTLISQWARKFKKVQAKKTREIK